VKRRNGETGREKPKLVIASQQPSEAISGSIASRPEKALTAEVAEESRGKQN
jgi:hypothetical protein